MTNLNPDKFIRKAVYAKVNNIVVNTKTIKCFDSRVLDAPNEYVLLTAQNKNELKPNKCEKEWDTSLLIELYTKSSSSGNSASRVLLNDIEQEIKTLLDDNLTIDNFEVITKTVTFENSLETITDTEIIFRSFLRLNLIF